MRRSRATGTGRSDVSARKPGRDSERPLAFTGLSSSVSGSAFINSATDGMMMLLKLLQFASQSWPDSQTSFRIPNSVLRTRQPSHKHLERLIQERQRILLPGRLIAGPENENARVERPGKLQRDGRQFSDVVFFSQLCDHFQKRDAQRYCLA